MADKESTGELVKQDTEGNVAEQVDCPRRVWIMSEPIAVTARRNWVKAGWHPPSE